jgi:hypothetical protein
MFYVQILYEEKLSSIWITIIFLFISLIFLFLILYQVFIGPLGNNPAPNWVLTIIFLVFLFLSFNFIRLVIQITPQFIIVGYGIFKHKIALENIEDINRDKSLFIKYGGWGIRFGRSEGKRYMAYTIPEASNVALLIKKGRFRKFIFSTKNPDELINIINQIAEKRF